MLLKVLHIIKYAFIGAGMVYMAAGCSVKGSLPFYHSANFTPLWKTDTLKEPLHTIADFSFTNQDGKQITNDSVKGKIYAANFFFTSCGSICPTMTNHLLKVQKAFPNNERVSILSYSVAPWIDSVARLKSYATRFKMDKRWHLLTGDKATIYKLARQSYYAEEQIGFTKDSSDFLHTEHILLIDKNRHIRGIYNGTLQLEVERMIDDMKILLRE
jgi:protein SCO1